MTHLSMSDLIKWRDAPSEADRVRIMAHIASCGQCAARHAEVVRTRPFVEPLPARDLGDFVARGRAVRTGLSMSASGHRRRWLTRVVPFAAAAALVAALILPLSQRTDEPSVLRGNAVVLTLIRPVATVVDGDQLSFEWAVPAGADRLRLQVFDMSAPEQPLLRREVSGMRYDPSPEERSLLPTGRDLYWFLEYRTAQSATLVSPAAKFRLQ